MQTPKRSPLPENSSRCRFPRHSQSQKQERKFFSLGASKLRSSIQFLFGFFPLRMRPIKNQILWEPGLENPNVNQTADHSTLFSKNDKIIAA